MDNYFLNTPTYKIWIKLLESIIPGFSSMLKEKTFRFGDINFNQDEVKFHYHNNKEELDIIFHDNSLFLHTEEICNFRSN